MRLANEKVRFTGNTLYEDIIFRKDEVLKRAVEHNDLTLKGSIGVGDTESDISFLELVENPIAFNPSSALYRTATRRNWDVVVERKDVIYEI